MIKETEAGMCRLGVHFILKSHTSPGHGQALSFGCSPKKTMELYRALPGTRNISYPLADQAALQEVNPEALAMQLVRRAMEGS